MKHHDVFEHNTFEMDILNEMGDVDSYIFYCVVFNTDIAITEAWLWAVGKEK